LNKQGEVYAMGDDSFGQCGQGAKDRSTVAPFYQTQVSKPSLVKLPEKVVKVVCGYRHSLAITEDGNLFGWGYNN
jgi:alpha-tubulin suppressor-like RCC1 family protein